MSNPLVGHSSAATAFNVKNYPYGFKLKCEMRFWVESVPGKGDRYVMQSVNPKTGRLNAPKKSVYSTYIYMTIDSDGHVHPVYLNARSSDFLYNIQSLFALFGEDAFSEIQQQNIRTEFSHNFVMECAFVARRIKDESLHQKYVEWAGKIAARVINIEFINIFNDWEECPIKLQESVTSV